MNNRPTDNNNNHSKKQELIDNYRSNYDQQYFRSFLELSTTKLDVNDNNPIKITNYQIDYINNLLQNDNISRDEFISALNILTYDQIGYVGW